jgi:hypothetical protein
MRVERNSTVSMTLSLLIVISIDSLPTRPNQQVLGLVPGI